MSSVHAGPARRSRAWRLLRSLGRGVKIVLMAFAALGPAPPPLPPPPRAVAALHAPGRARAAKLR